jgi:hypothetical protein
MRLVFFFSKFGFGLISGLRFRACSKFRLDFGCEKFEVCTWGKIRVDSDVTNFEDIFKADSEGSFEG